MFVGQALYAFSIYCVSVLIFCGLTRCINGDMSGNGVEVIGACWLLGGKRWVGKFTSSVVVFFNEVVRLVEDRCSLRGFWLPWEAYDFDRGRRWDFDAHKG